MSVKPIPEGYHSITPYLMVPPGSKIIEFLVAVFGAKVLRVMENPAGGVGHAELEIGNSKIMLGEACGQWKPTQSSIYVYVADCDATYQAALAAGATTLYEPTTHWYGDRSGGVIDPAGNVWFIGTHVEDVSEEELRRRHAENRKSA